MLASPSCAGTSISSTLRHLNSTCQQGAFHTACKFQLYPSSAPSEPDCSHKRTRLRMRLGEPPELGTLVLAGMLSEPLNVHSGVENIVRPPIPARLVVSPA